MSKRKTYSRAKGRGNGGGYFHFPHAISTQSNIAQMSYHAKALLLDLGSQYKGYNNGDLSIVWQFMVKRGWKSKQTLYKARDELLELGLVVITQYGDRKRPTLYALTWREIDKLSDAVSVTKNFKKGDIINTWKINH